MANLVAAGIDPAFVAARVLAGIADNDLYILTHPELRDVIAGRFDRIWPPSKAALLETAPPEAIAARLVICTCRHWRRLFPKYLPT